MTMSSSLIGHNHPPTDAAVAAQVEPGDATPEKWTFETRGDLPPDLPKMHFFQCDTHALYTALLRMPLDHRGFYMTALLAMYDRMEPLPADDREGMIATGVTDIRIYRRLKDALINAERCLVQKPSGRISNARFEEEIEKYVQKFHNRSAGRKKIGAENGDAPLAKPVANGLAKGVASGVADANVAADLSEKINKISDAVLSIQAQMKVNDPDKLKDRVIKEEEEKEEEDTAESESLDEPLSETHVSDVDGSGSNQKSKTIYSASFEAFWDDYPQTKGMSKIGAWRKWKKLSADLQAQARAALPEFKRQFEERRRRSADAVPLHAQGYLNQRRFESILEKSSGVAKAPWWVDPVKVAKITPDRWRSAIAKHANGIWPVDTLGPAPGRPNCVVPSDIVRELRLTEIYTDGGIKRPEFSNLGVGS